MNAIRLAGTSLLFSGLMFVFATMPVPARAGESMSDLLALARQNDADYRAAAAARDAGLQARVIGRALLLPTASASYELGSSELNRNFLNGALPLDYSTNSRTLVWRITQPIFSLERWYSWREEDSRSVLAELNFALATAELKLRLSRAVFDTLLSVDNLQLAEAQHQTLISQRREAENLRQAGVLTLTEVEDTRARELSVQASALEAGFSLQMRRRELARIVGILQPDSPNPLPRWPLTPPVPNDLEYWLGRVRDANPKVVSATMNYEIAGLTSKRTQSAHLPSLDLIASSTRTQNPNSFTAVERSGGLSLRLTVPLFEGGRTNGVANRAAALRVQAGEELESTRRDAEVKAAEAFLGMANASGKSRALEQALVAAQTSLKGATVGRQAGLRTHTDVLNAQQQVFAVQRDLNKERYNHALAGLQLQSLAGQLSDDGIAVFEKSTDGEIAH